jgi:fructokinase
MINSDSGLAQIIVFGEVLFDCFPNRKRVIGGAPFNLAWALRGFGYSPVFLSAVGEDPEGRRVRRKMAEWGMVTDALQTDADHATGVVEVRINDGEPSYDICKNRAWDFVDDEAWGATEMICHGLLALRSERSRATFEKLVERSKAKRFFDINLRPPYDSMELVKKWIFNVDWLKLTIDELESLLGGRSVDFEDSIPAVEALRSKYAIHNVLLTGGSRGARIIGEVGQAACIPAPTPDPFIDTVGAGDSFSAYTLHGILSGMPINEIVKNASHFAAKVCGIQGATSSDLSFYR